VRIFKNTWFSRFTRKENISDDELKELVSILEAEQAEADLGGRVFKVRLARSGEGKSGGYRIVVFFKSKFRTFFIYGFAKSDKGNIDKGELRLFKKDAKDYFSLTDEEIENRKRKGTLIEVL